MSNQSATLYLLRLHLFIQIVSGCVYTHTLAQSSLLHTRVSLQYTHSPLYQILDELKQTYHIPFSYFKNQLPLDRKISLSVNNEPLYAVLNSMCLQAEIRYQVIGGQIVLREELKYPDHTLSAPTYTSTSGPPVSASIYNPVADKTYPAHITHSQTRSHAPEKSAGKSLPKTKAAYPKQALVLQQKINAGSFSLLQNPCSLTELPVATILTHPMDFRAVLQPPEAALSYTRATYQLALLPGISTHGIHPGEYINVVSLNLLAGYSAGNTLVEIGGLSNFNQTHVSGLQISGIANVTGGNKFAGLNTREKQKLEKEKHESNLQGVQFAGLTNIVDGHVAGWQTAGAVNVVKNSLQGVQAAGISNLVRTFSFGVQLAGFSNVSMESMDGVQVAALYNYTAGELHGIQLGAFNQAGKIEGKRSQVAAGHTGLQLGLLNTARRMNGFQFGLINIGGNMAGTQIGLINIHRNKKGNGVPIGLLNITSAGQFVRLYASELFMTNLEVSTGSLKIQNMLSIGYNPVFMRTNQPLWSVGYSIGQIKRPTQAFFYSYDAGFANVNVGAKTSRHLNLLARTRATAGYKIQLRKMDFHLFGGLTLNTFISEADTPALSPQFLRIYERNTSRSHMEVWPGLVAGIHL